jgi:hypothetical protein
VSDPDEPDGIDTGGSTVPPYPGRRSTADMADSSRAYQDGANVGGATGPTEDPDQRATGGDSTDAATGSPADEQPADRAPQTAPDDEGVGPAHEPGTPRAEDQS